MPDQPLQLLDGGYITWVDPHDSGLSQLQGGDHEPVLLGEQRALRVEHRGDVDRVILCGRFGSERERAADTHDGSAGDAALVGVLWVLFGYSMVFGDSYGGAGMHSRSHEAVRRAW